MPVLLSGRTGFCFDFDAKEKNRFDNIKIDSFLDFLEYVGVHSWQNCSFVDYIVLKMMMEYLCFPVAFKPRMAGDTQARATIFFFFGGHVSLIT